MDSTDSKWTEMKAWIDALTDEGRMCLLQRLKDMNEAMTDREKEARAMLWTGEQVTTAQEEAYREGLKDGQEETSLWDDDETGTWKHFRGWDFEPTLGDFRDGVPPLSRLVNGVMLYRYPTERERNVVLTRSQKVVFPVKRLSTAPYEVHETYSIPKKEWDAGARWTLGRFLLYARRVYSKNHGKAVKEMGDHQFWEDINETDGTMYVGS